MELGAFWGQINHAQNNTITQLYVSARKHTHINWLVNQPVKTTPSHNCISLSLSYPKP